MAAERPHGVHAATVDHALRPESAAEAQAVAALCARLAIPHQILRWEGDKPASRLQERAREARYDLLAQEAARVGAGAVVTAHHMDDQAETVLFRLARGSGLAGLAGMAERSRRGSIEIVRPLLGWRKAELIAYCEARGVAYVRDPSNENSAFARPRLRALAETLAAEGLDAPALARLAARAARAETALVRAVEQADARLGLGAHSHCDAQALAAEPEEIVRRLLTPDGAPLDAMERLTTDLIAAVAARRRFAANVAGRLVRYDGRAKVSLAPEPPRRTRTTPPVNATPASTSASPAQADSATGSPSASAPRISPTNGTI